MSDFREFLAGLPGKMSQKNIDAIVEHVESAGIVDAIVETVEIAGARLEVERRDVGGLVIGFDANGNAVTVAFPAGTVVTA